MPQHRNTMNRIFGGLLMRRAYEIAFACSYAFAGSRPQFVDVDRVDFLAPVEVGDLLHLEAEVLHTSGRREVRKGGWEKVVRAPEVHVEVTATVTRPEEVRTHLSNTFAFSFALPDADSVRRVLPGSLDDARRMVARAR
eukprot:CAMPEP_0206020492 /NCGR_PEP_ID=MMETSP1464-20131121/31154_1 /ASSEMBLY_ACC=CAM_ASM_001124 /TAXON_ID=119497 /ORGANISM="Exanthemachrysis gayraliae, Strain RCC1523" /LENGTH=138 /DNA_ID=CAMNT_0053394427 /DNA_START=26 /DNA_END=438 /DNA_ORIENTATION=-